MTDIGSMLEAIGAIKSRRGQPLTSPWPLMLELAKAHECRAFVETGTWHGGMVQQAAKAGWFQVIRSIEVLQEPAEAAARKFSDNDKIKIHHGSSRDALGILIQECVGHRILYWLDAHYSSGKTGHDAVSHCPLREELAQIRECGRVEDVICIDDCRDLASRPGNAYPTAQETVDLLLMINPHYDIRLSQVHSGVLVAAPRSSGSPPI